MLKLVILLSISSLACCQYSRNRDLPQEELEPMYDVPQIRSQTDKNRLFHRPASVHYVNIGQELAGDYKFGYDTGKANDGQSFREETRLPDGTVQGAYGYVDETGRQRIVKYTAGKNGFKAEGDIGPHRGPKPSAAAPEPARRLPSPAQQAAYRPEAPSQQMYRPSTSSHAQRRNPHQESYNQPRTAATPQQQYISPQPSYRAPAQPAPRNQYVPSAEPAYRSPPQTVARALPVQEVALPPPTANRVPVSSQRAQTQRQLTRPRHATQPPKRVQYDEPDYDYDNDVRERRLAPIDTSLLNYNIGVSQ